MFKEGKMERSKWYLAFLLLFVAAASGQRPSGQSSAKPAIQGCAAIYLYNGPYQCSNGSSCGSYYHLKERTAISTTRECASCSCRHPSAVTSTISLCPLIHACSPK